MKGSVVPLAARVQNGLQRLLAADAVGGRRREGIVQSISESHILLQISAKSLSEDGRRELAGLKPVQKYALE
ncbi:MAG: hypothetical protein KGJ79_06595 [Alphaproteobacteria bacterium]|nr:hypothetical protein [Alphaproteobacteria bacterium]